MNFRAGSLIKPFDSKRRSRLRHTISLRTPLGCLHSHSLQTSCEMKRLLFSGCEPIIFLMVAISCLVTDRFRYVMIVSIPDTIDHQELERNLFLKKTCGEVLNPKLKTIIARERLQILEADDGFCEVLKKAEMHGLRRKVRRALLRRWRKEKTRAVPSASSIFRYLAKFHDNEQEKQRWHRKAFIPVSNEHLQGFARINKDLAAFSGFQNSESTATLDMDATLVATNKTDALFCYKGYKAYQPLNTWWFEQGIILHTEFRDGNVPAGFEQLRVFKEALDCLPEEVKQVRFRSDTAGYQHNLLKYCATGENSRFGVIEFAIGCDVTKEFKKAVAQVEELEWKPIYKTAYDKKYKTGVECGLRFVMFPMRSVTASKAPNTDIWQSVKFWISSRNCLAWIVR